MEIYKIYYSILDPDLKICMIKTCLFVVFFLDFLYFSSNTAICVILRV